MINQSRWSLTDSSCFNNLCSTPRFMRTFSYFSHRDLWEHSRIFQLSCLAWVDRCSSHPLSIGNGDFQRTISVHTEFCLRIGWRVINTAHEKRLFHDSLTFQPENVFNFVYKYFSFNRIMHIYTSVLMFANVKTLKSLFIIFVSSWLLFVFQTGLRETNDSIFKVFGNMILKFVKTYFWRPKIDLENVPICQSRNTIAINTMIIIKRRRRIPYWKLLFAWSKALSTRLVYALWTSYNLLSTVFESLASYAIILLFTDRADLIAGSLRKVNSIFKLYGVISSLR